MAEERGHRARTQTKHPPVSYMATMAHYTKGFVGLGLFAMGDAIKNSGLLLGPPLVIVLSCICLYCQHLLLNASDELEKELQLEDSPDFATTVELCFTSGPEKIHNFGVAMRRITNVLICLTHLGFCCVYIVFVATTVVQLWDMHGHSCDIHLIMPLVTVPILFTSLIKDLKYLAPVSYLADTLLLVSTTICLYYANTGSPSISSRNYVSKFSSLPLFFGTCIFSMITIGLVLPMKQEMAVPSQFDSPLGVMNVSTVFVTVIYLVMGFTSYLHYGDEIKGSVTLNIPQKEVLAQFVRGATGGAIMFTYPVQFYIPMQILWSGLCDSYGPFAHPIIAEMILRTVIVLATLFLAEVIPFLSSFISLVGSLSGAALALMIPPVLEYVRRWKASSVTVWLTAKDLVLFTVGIMGAVTGTAISISTIIENIENEYKNHTTTNKTLVA